MLHGDKIPAKKTSAAKKTKEAPGERRCRVDVVFRPGLLISLPSLLIMIEDP